jgi:hypothetical protein
MMTKENITVMFTLNDELDEAGKVRLQAALQETLEEFFIKKFVDETRMTRIIKVEALRRYGTGV